MGLSGGHLPALNRTHHYGIAAEREIGGVPTGEAGEEGEEEPAWDPFEVVDSGPIRVRARSA